MDPYHNNYGLIFFLTIWMVRQINGARAQAAPGSPTFLSEGMSNAIILLQSKFTYGYK